MEVTLLQSSLLRTVLLKSRKEITMNKTNNIKKSVSLLILIGLSLLFSACYQTDKEIPVAETPAFELDETVEAGFSGVDDVGSYIVDSTNGLQRENGYTLLIEERIYKDLAKSRFVVTQKYNGVQTRSVDLKAVTLSAYSRDSSMTIDSADTLKVSTTNVDIRSFQSSNEFVSDLYDYSNDDTIGFVVSSDTSPNSNGADGEVISDLYDRRYEESTPMRSRAKKMCGSVSVEFTLADYEPVTLDTCYRPSYSAHE